ncbi:MAG: sulfatase [bacterium]|nr:sulfatase [bacterium]
MLGALLGCSEHADDAQARPRPNVVLISIDTLRPDHLGCYGHVRETSPALDRLAAQGTRFADVSSTSPWTLPAHATMLTGMYPGSHGVRDQVHRLPDDAVTLAEELRGAGWRTAAVVNSYYVGAPSFRLGQGFEHFDGVPEMADDPATGQRRIVNSGDEVVRKARGRLTQLPAGEPFFLFLHFYDVHTDLTPKAHYRELLVGDYSGALDGSTAQLAALRDRGERLGADDLRWLREMYDAEIRQLDDVLAGFFEWMRAEGLFENTLVVVTSDHGEEYHEHGGLLHGRTQYQEVLAVPLILCGPGVPADHIVEAPVSLVDVVPTVLALVDVDSSTPRDGIDLFAASQPRALFSEANHNVRAAGKLVSDTNCMIRVGDDKLVLDRRTDAVELYDLANDPSEQVDRSAADVARTEELLARLRAFLGAARAPDTIAAPGADAAKTLQAAGYAGSDDE